MADEIEETAESDSRFPSGEWVGFWVQRSLYGNDRKRVEFTLRFANGEVTGQGRDFIDQCVIRGRYDVKSGEVTFQKRHVNLRYDVFYRGFAEQVKKGIWGVWELPSDRDGFHIWPKGIADPTVDRLEEEADVPLKERAPRREKKKRPVGA